MIILIMEIQMVWQQWCKGPKDDEVVYPSRGLFLVLYMDYALLLTLMHFLLFWKTIYMPAYCNVLMLWLQYLVDENIYMYVYICITVGDPMITIQLTVYFRHIFVTLSNQDQNFNQYFMFYFVFNFFGKKLVDIGEVKLLTIII